MKYKGERKLNTKKNNTVNFKGFGIYLLLIAGIVLVWFWLSGTASTSSYTKSDFQKDLVNDNVIAVRVVQSSEIPTGSLRVTLKD